MFNFIMLYLLLWKISIEIVCKIENILKFLRIDLKIASIYKFLIRSEFFPEFSCMMYEYFFDCIFYIY